MVYLLKSYVAMIFTYQFIQVLYQHPYKEIAMGEAYRACKTT